MTTSLASLPSAGPRPFRGPARVSGGVSPVPTTLGVFADPQNEAGRVTVEGETEGLRLGLWLWLGGGHGLAGVHGLHVEVGRARTPACPRQRSVRTVLAPGDMQLPLAA